MIEPTTRRAYLHLWSAWNASSRPAWRPVRRAGPTRHRSTEAFSHGPHAAPFPGAAGCGSAGAAGPGTHRPLLRPDEVTAQDRRKRWGVYRALVSFPPKVRLRQKTFECLRDSTPQVDRATNDRKRGSFLPGALFLRWSVPGTWVTVYSGDFRWGTISPRRARSLRVGPRRLLNRTTLRNQELLLLEVPCRRAGTSSPSEAEDGSLVDQCQWHCQVESPSGTVGG